MSATALFLRAETSAVNVIPDLPYKQGAASNDYEQERCKLDLYLPEKRERFATLVWFYGGGLTNGSKAGKDTVKIARSLAASGVAVVVPDYRLSPKAVFPTYVEDAAAAVAWAHGHIEEHGGDAGKIFVGGHSAGAYLALMVGLAPQHLAKHGLGPDAIAGLIPVSGQTVTHYTVRGERGQGGRFTVTADDAAPVHYARAETPPMLLIYAERDMPARAEENEYLAAVLKGAGNQQVTALKIPDREHGSVGHRIAEPGDPARTALLEFIDATSKSR